MIKKNGIIEQSIFFQSKWLADSSTHWRFRMKETSIPGVEMIMANWAPMRRRSMNQSW